MELGILNAVALLTSISASSITSTALGQTHAACLQTDPDTSNREKVQEGDRKIFVMDLAKTILDSTKTVATKLSLSVVKVFAF